MRAPILFIYHGGCYDGFTAAWLFNKFSKKKETIVDRPVEYFPAHYGGEPPDCKGKEVWMVDFSYKRDVMIEKVIKPSTRTFVFDHHKTAQADLDDILQDIRRDGLQRDQDKIIFDMERCGSAILYDELSRDMGQRAGVHTPSMTGLRGVWLVDYIHDRDLWKWELPDSQYVSAYIAALPMTFEAWDEAEKMGIKAMVEGGRAIKRYIDTFGNKAREQARFETIGAYKVPVINVPYMNCSDHVGGRAEQYPEAPFAASFFRTLEGSWQFSLRSRGDFDVSEVAKLYGGGGHKSAAGFRVENLPWCLCVKVGEDVA